MMPADVDHATRTPLDENLRGDGPSESGEVFMTTLMPWVFVSSLILTGSRSGFWQDRGERSSVEDVRSRIAGTWRGNSVCVVKNSPCHDEVNVYRFSEAAGKPNIFSVTAGKVVDGREIVMGTGEWKYDAEKQVVECEKPTIRLTVNGDKMEGALTLKDGTDYRRIYLKKEN
jgi:hypothetical protein